MTDLTDRQRERRAVFLFAGVATAVLVWVVGWAQVFDPGGDVARVPRWRYHAPLLLLGLGLLAGPRRVDRVQVRTVQHMLLCVAGIACGVSVAWFVAHGTGDPPPRTFLIALGTLVGVGALLSLLERVAPRRSVTLVSCVGTGVALAAGFAALSQMGYLEELGWHGPGRRAVVETLGGVLGELKRGPGLRYALQVACSAAPFFLVARRRGVGLGVGLGASVAGVTACSGLVGEPGDRFAPLVLGAAFAFPLAFAFADRYSAEPEEPAPAGSDSSR